MNIPIYTAGPLGFSEPGRHFHNEVFLPMLRRIGYTPLDPWVLTDVTPALNLPAGSPERREMWRKLNPSIAYNNMRAIMESKIIVANLDGPDVDSGTAAEIGFAVAVKRLIIGYRSDFRLSSENEGAKINLQVEYFITSSGGEIVTTLVDLEKVLTVWRNKLLGPTVPY